MFDVLQKTIIAWWDRDPLSESAAAAYYAVFSLPGLMIIIMGMAAMAFEQQQIESQILSHIRTVFGAEMAKNVSMIAESTQHKNRDVWALVAGASTLFFGATGLFVQLQKSLNTIWHVEVKKNVGFRKFLKSRVTALGVAISIGFLLVMSLSVTAGMTALSEWLASQFSPAMFYFFYFLNYFLSLVTISVLFAVIFKVLPDIHLRWRDAIKGGVLSALLFTAGEYGLSVYFKMATPESAFGATGSIILFLIWVYYSCVIILFGAEFTRVYMEKVTGEKAKLTDIAKPIS